MPTRKQLSDNWSFEMSFPELRRDEPYKKDRLTKKIGTQNQPFPQKVVYIAHAIGGNIADNVTDLKRIYQTICLTRYDVVPFCPYLADVLSLYDNVAEHRKRGINNNWIHFARNSFDELWLTGPVVSDGMNTEIAWAELYRIPVHNYINYF